MCSPAGSVTAATGARLPGLAELPPAAAAEALTGCPAGLLPALTAEVVVAAGGDSAPPSKLALAAGGTEMLAAAELLPPTVDAARAQCRACISVMATKGPTLSAAAAPAGDLPAATPRGLAPPADAALPAAADVLPAGSSCPSHQQLTALSSCKQQKCLLLLSLLLYQQQVLPEGSAEPGCHQCCPACLQQRDLQVDCFQHRPGSCYQQLPRMLHGPLQRWAEPQRPQCQHCCWAAHAAHPALAWGCYLPKAVVEEPVHWMHHR